jgi:ABC-type Fe3+-hydroxamate transport system substrate-binding protein
MIIILSLLLLPYAVSASPEISSWNNNKTGNNSSDIAINAGDSVLFGVSANETVNWTWTLDGVDQNTNQGEWTHTFPSYGTYNVSVSGSNVNGSTPQPINWTVVSTLTFTDALGNNVTITKKPERIVSLAPSNTEILFALGLGDRVVGVTSYADYPPEALNKTKIEWP